MRKIGVVSVGRSDYGIYLPLLKKIHADPELQLLLFVSGAHVEERYGMTVRLIEADGFPIVERIPMLLPADEPEAIAESIGRGVQGMARAFARNRPDILLLLGDRFEMHAAAVAAMPLNIPLAHIGGGEITEGAIDDSLRHSLTKLSHLHFAYTDEYAGRIVQMGEEPWRVVVTGALGLDNLREVQILLASELEQRLGFSLPRQFLLVTFHPVTLELDRTEWQIDELLSALKTARMAVIFTMPNADPGNSIIRRKMEDFVAGRDSSKAKAVENLGTQMYFSVLSHATAMVGNSSSGIVEAPSFKLPVVNVGTRQDGRTRARNIVDVGYEREQILEGIRHATSEPFRRSLDGLVNPYGDGHAAPKILEKLKDVALDHKLLRKRFYRQERERSAER